MAVGQIKQAQSKIEQKQFEQLCKMQCTEMEIASFFDVSKDTLIRWCKENYGVDFATIYSQKREGGKIAIRRFQLQQAEKNPTMAIWLGKQYLGQTDKIENTQYIAKEPVLNINITRNEDIKEEFYKEEE